MATLQKIRSKGKVLVVVVGLALFAFIAEEFVRSLTYTQSENRQRIGSVYGDHINQQEFNNLVEEYTDVLKFTNGITSLSDEQNSMLRDQVWQTYVSNKLIEHECEKLGLTVTDAEMQSIINSGRNMLLSQTPFRNQQGAFDANQLKQFLSQYDEVISNNDLGNEVKEQYTQMYSYWKYIEKSIRQQTLAQKYQALLAGTLKSNPIAAKASFEGRTTPLLKRQGRRGEGDRRRPEGQVCRAEGDVPHHTGVTRHQVYRCSRDSQQGRCGGSEQGDERLCRGSGTGCRRSQDRARGFKPDSLQPAAHQRKDPAQRHRC